MTKEPLVIEHIVNEKTTSGCYRVSAVIEGEELWFESDLDLVASPEAFLSVFLLPAMKSGRPIKSSHTVDPVWHNNMDAIQDIFHKWWGYEKIQIHSPVSTSYVNRSEKKAVLFTAGVDSFYSLLRYPEPIDAVLFVEGMDIPLGDPDYRAYVRRHVQKIASERGVEFYNIITNLREHSLFRTVDYTSSHGAALTACAHLLTKHLGHLIVNSSSILEHDVPVGTHWDTDPLWSSSALTVEHWGHHIWRWNKLIDIMREPVVRKNLRVCLNKLPVGILNCGKCEKCVRTMMPLYQHDQLQGFESLQPPVSLLRSISRVPKVKPASQFVYEGYIDNEKDPEIRQAIKGLLRRSRGPAMKLRRSFRKRYWRFVDWLQRN